MDYTVTFQDYDGTVLKTEQVNKGDDATTTSNPSREGYTFTGWDKSFISITSDLTITAQYKENELIELRVKYDSIDKDGRTIESNIIKEDKYYLELGEHTIYAPDIEGYITPEPSIVDVTTDFIWMKPVLIFNYLIVEGHDPNLIEPITLYVHHEDREGNTLKETDVYENVTNRKYTAKSFAKNSNSYVPLFDDYYIKIEDGITEYELTIVYYIGLGNGPIGTVTIHYQDEEGNTLENSLTCNILCSQTFYALDIDGYKPVQDSITFTMEYGQIHHLYPEYTHTFVYTKEDEK